VTATCSTLTVSQKSKTQKVLQMGKFQGCIFNTKIMQTHCYTEQEIKKVLVIDFLKRNNLKH